MLGIGSGPPASATGWQPHAVQRHAGRSRLNGWVKIARDDSVIVAVPRAEMGQGIHTALATLVAEEMDARWDQVGSRIHRKTASIAMSRC